MSQLAYILGALCVGLASAVQVGLISSLARLRGPTETTWINMLGSVVGLALVLSWESTRSDPPDLPSPFNNVLSFLGVAMIAAVGLTISMRGLSPHLAFAGFLGFVYVIGAALFAPKLGIALFACCVTAGTLFGSVILDHYGAFGADVHRVSLVKVLGLLALFGGVLMVRTGK